MRSQGRSGVNIPQPPDYYVAWAKFFALLLQIIVPISVHS